MSVLQQHGQGELTESTDAQTIGFNAASLEAAYPLEGINMESSILGRKQMFSRRARNSITPASLRPGWGADKEI